MYKQENRWGKVLVANGVPIGPDPKCKLILRVISEFGPREQVNLTFRVTQASGGGKERINLSIKDRATVGESVMETVYATSENALGV